MPFPEPEHSFTDIETLFMQSITADAVLAAVDMKLFDHTHAKPVKAQALALTLNLLPEPLEAMLTMLTASGLLVATDEGFMNTPMIDEHLVSTSPLYRGDALLVRKMFENLVKQDMSALLKGEKNPPKHSGVRWADTRSIRSMLQHTLDGQLQGATEFLTGLPEFPSFRTMVDIGGNHGQYSMELLARNPELTGTILDLPEVAEAARKRCEEAGYGERIHCQPFDLNKDTLSENAYDLALTSHSLYMCIDRLDEVIGSIAASLRPGGCFASHHFSREGGLPEHHLATNEFINRLSGRKSHFLERDRLEGILSRNGFSDFTHIFTGKERQTLLLVARKK